jgi:nicotinate phosphoribosyltransferase
MAFAREDDAFRAYHRIFPEDTTLLIDTYDTLQGARNAAKLGPSIRAVRLDSGDLLTLSRQVRAILDEAGLTGTQIFASGDLNETKIRALLEAGAPIDAFGVGTDLATSRDCPALGGVYKLVCIEEEGRHRPTLKLSTGKQTYPEAKQVYRRRDAEGRVESDLLALFDEPAEGEPLLRSVLREGRLVEPLPSLLESRSRALTEREALPAAARCLEDPRPIPVALSPGLRSLTERLAAERG